jgi:transcriptional regulator with XRE-family HTH domain
MDEKERQELEKYFIYSDKTIFEILDANRKDKTKPGLKDWVRYARVTLGYSQEEFAKWLHIKQNTLSRYETGTRQVPFILYMDLCHELGYEWEMKRRREKYGNDDELVKNFDEWKEKSKEGLE